MAHVELSNVDPRTKIVWPYFDQHSLSGRLVIARIDEPVAKGRVVDAPLP